MTWRSTAGLAIAVLALGACGRKGPVRPPQLAAPQAIADLAARNEQDGVRLVWGRPSRYVDGSRMNDLGRFTVERAAAGAVGFELLATLPVSDRQRFRRSKSFRFLDRDVTERAAYRYRVVSFTLDGYGSAPSNEVAITRATPPAASAEEAPETSPQGTQ